MSYKLHNPKSHTSALSIPCWLSQVPIKKLSQNAKLVYARLCQWSDQEGHAFRSAPDLAQELGMCVRSVVKAITELRKAGLIGSYLPQAGGINHFEFYDHHWMHEPIKKQLVYNSTKKQPAHDDALPHARSCVTPTHDRACINNKEIKETKREGANASHSEKSSSKDKTETSAFTAEELQEFFNKKFSGLDITYQEVFENCKNHYEAKGQWVTYKKWKDWLERERLDSYKKVKFQREQSTPLFTIEEQQKISKAKHALKMEKFGAKIEVFLPDEQERIECFKLLEREKALEAKACQPKSQKKNARKSSLTSVSSLVSALASLQPDSCVKTQNEIC